MDALRESLAALSHAQWAGWMDYLFGLSVEMPNGTVVIPKALVARWKRQMATKYALLSEGEKDSDRTEADKVIALLGNAHEHV